MSPSPTITARQLWGHGHHETTSTTGTKDWCTPVILPTGGVLIIGDNLTTTLAARATFKLPCDSRSSILSPDTTGNSTVIGFSQPFYASISPQTYALATATVISYILVILIFITPRTFYVGGPGGGGGFLSRHGISASKPIVGVGRRPLLQKIATITVAISLTIASADTFSVAQEQYRDGYIDSGALVDDVVSSTLIKVVRIVSDSFLWLAQVQTLIRLFPRHKEKVTIKWLGFALVTSDITFSILDSFLNNDSGSRPRSFQDAIPALNYLFELAISLIYASCVIYYSLSKRRFAFWHPKMRNVCLVALVSLVSVLIPVVFFVLDISLPSVAGWGEYIRWVGAAAASVVVWEWVERIEALERDERKDGILGREIFDGDEMLGRDSADGGDWSGRGDGKGDDRDVEKSASLGFVTTFNKARARLPVRRRRKRPSSRDGASGGLSGTTVHGPNANANPLAPPHPAVSPPDRSDTASAASTVYAIRYHNLSSPSPAVQDVQPEQAPRQEVPASKETSDGSSEEAAMVAAKHGEGQGNPSQSTVNRQQQFWQTVPNPFKRRRAEPPAEVAGAQIASGMRRSPIDRTLNIRDRLGAFASAQKDRFGRHGSGPAAPLPVYNHSAPKNNERTWSPDEVRHSSSAAQSHETEASGALPAEHGYVQASTVPPTVQPGQGVVIPIQREHTWSAPDASTSRPSATSAAEMNNSQIPSDTPNTNDQSGRVVSTPRQTHEPEHATRGSQSRDVHFEADIDGQSTPTQKDYRPLQSGNTIQQSGPSRSGHSGEIVVPPISQTPRQNEAEHSTTPQHSDNDAVREPASSTPDVHSATPTISPPRTSAVHGDTEGLSDGPSQPVADTADGRDTGGTDQSR